MNAAGCNRTVDGRLLRLLDVDALISDVPGQLRAELAAERPRRTPFAAL